MTRRASRCARSERPELRCIGERPREERLDPCDPVGAERERLGRRRATLADSASGARRVADERLPLRAALGAGGDVRQVAGQPEQLELEREPERVEGRPVGGVRRVVEKIEEARQRDERPLVRLLLAEQPQHRLGADHPDREAVVVLARLAVRSDELRRRSPSGARRARDGERGRRARAARAARRSATSSCARPSPPRRPGRAPRV